jgi:hypothetical protein
LINEGQMMKKLVIAAMALALSAGVNAQNNSTAGGSGATGFGGLTVASLTALGISAAVAAAIISNNQGVTLPDPITEDQLKCNDGDGAPVAGICTTTSTGTTTATVSVSGTVTNTITVVPVTVTYPAIVVPGN